MAQQFETAQFLPPAVAPRPVGGARLLRALRGRAGVAADGGRERAATRQPLGGRHVPDAEAHRAGLDAEQSAYDKWLDRTAEREVARSDRLHGAEGVIPRPLWIVALPVGPPDLRLHALLRRQRRAGPGAGGADRLGGAGPLGVPGPGGVPRQPLPAARRPGSSPPRWSAPSSCWTRGARWSATRSRRPVTTAARRDGHDPGPPGVGGRDRRDGPARAGGRGDGLVRLPGLPVARRPGARGRARDGDAGGVGSRLGPGQPPGADRRRDLHAVGRCLRRRATRSWRPSTAAASATSSGPRSTAGSRRGRWSTPRRPRRPSRCPSTGSRRFEDADRLEAEAAAAGEEVRADVERANRYVLAVVLFATVLALAGIAARLRIFPVRVALLGGRVGRLPRHRRLARDLPGQRVSEPAAPGWHPERPRLRPFRLVLSWLLSALALLVAAWLVPGVTITGFWGAVLAAALIAVLNALLPPVIAALRLPYTRGAELHPVLLLDALLLELAADDRARRDPGRRLRVGLLTALVAAAAGIILEVVFGTNDDDAYNLRVVQRIAARDGRHDPDLGARDRLPRDRRPLPARPAPGHARRQRPGDGALARRRHPPAAPSGRPTPRPRPAPARPGSCWARTTTSPRSGGSRRRPAA